MRRGVKIAIIVGTIVLILIGIAIPIYYNFANRTAYHLTGIEKTSYTVDDFKNDTELELYQNGTFHIHIAHKTEGISFTGIGTYQLNDKTYELKFVQAYARNNHGNIIEYTSQCATSSIACIRTGSRIKFTDHKNQTFYFG